MSNNPNKELLSNFLGMDRHVDLLRTLDFLCMATEILLNEYNYDRMGYEIFIDAIEEGKNHKKRLEDMYRKSYE